MFDYEHVSYFKRLHRADGNKPFCCRLL